MDRTDSPLVGDDSESGGSHVVSDRGRIRALYVGEGRVDADAPAEIETRHERLEVTVEITRETALEALADGTYDCVIYAGEGDDVRTFLEDVREVDSRLPVIVYGEPAVFEDFSGRDGVDLVRRGGEGEYAVLTSRVENATARTSSSPRSEA